TERGLAPDLPCRLERAALLEATHAQRVERRIADSRRIHGCAAIGTERVCAPRSALGRLDVDLGLTAAEDEAVAGRLHVGAKRRAGRHLAIGAVALRDLAGIDLGLVANVAAMASAVDFHDVTLACCFAPRNGSSP